MGIGCILKLLACDIKAVTNIKNSYKYKYIYIYEISKINYINIHKKIQQMYKNYIWLPWCHEVHGSMGAHGAHGGPWGPWGPMGPWGPWDHRAHGCGPTPRPPGPTPAPRPQSGSVLHAGGIREFFMLYF